MITFIYSTCRIYPKIEWFLDSLYNQAGELSYPITSIQIVIVDFQLQNDPSRKQLFSEKVKDRFDYVHVEPKPSPWQGKYKLTQKDYFCAGSARNTGVCYAKYNYLVFVDDLSVMSPNLLGFIINSCNTNKTVAYGYKKVFNLNVEDGNIVTLTEHPAGIDSRWNLGPTANISGSNFFGYISIPLKTILDVNGYDEICNSLGGEDYNLGMRLEKNNVNLLYIRNSFYYETENIDQNDVTFCRIDPLLSQDEYNFLMKKYNITERIVPDGRNDLTHLTLDMLKRNKTWTEGNNYNLRELRTSIQNGGSFNNIFSNELKTIDGVYLTELDTNPVRHLDIQPDYVPPPPVVKKTNNTKFFWNKKSTK